MKREALLKDLRAEARAFMGTIPVVEWVMSRSSIMFKTISDKKMI
jgi:hypothetical protein